MHVQQPKPFNGIYFHSIGTGSAIDMLLAAALIVVVIVAVRFIIQSAR